MPSSTNISVLIELPNCNLLIRIGSTRSSVLFQFNPFQCSSHFRFVGLDFGLFTFFFFFAKLHFGCIDFAGTLHCNLSLPS